MGQAPAKGHNISLRGHEMINRREGEKSSDQQIV